MDEIVNIAYCVLSTQALTCTSVSLHNKKVICKKYMGIYYEKVKFCEQFDMMRGRPTIQEE